MTTSLDPITEAYIEVFAENLFKPRKQSETNRKELLERARDAEYYRQLESPTTTFMAFNIMEQLGLFSEAKKSKWADAEIYAYLKKNQTKIKSGDLCMAQMSNVTGRSRAKIKQVALKHQLAYKKVETQNYFSVPLGIWNRKLSKCSEML